jgi:hypothetical protein
MKNLFLILLFFQLGSTINASTGYFTRFAAQKPYFKLSLADVRHFFQQLLSNPRLRLSVGIGLGAVGAIGIGGIYLYKKLKKTREIKATEIKITEIDDTLSRFEGKFVPYGYDDLAKSLNELPTALLSKDQKTRLENIRNHYPGEFYWEDFSGNPPGINFESLIDERRLKKNDKTAYEEYRKERSTVCGRARQEIDRQLWFLDREVDLENINQATEQKIMEAAVYLNNSASDCLLEEMHVLLNDLKNKFPDYFYLPDKNGKFPSSTIPELLENRRKNDEYEQNPSSQSRATTNHPNLKENIFEIWPSSLLRKELSQ